MKNWKKATAIILMLMFSMAIMAACADQPVGNSTPGGSTSSQTEAPPENETEPTETEPAATDTQADTEETDNQADETIDTSEADNTGSQTSSTPEPSTAAQTTALTVEQLKETYQWIVETEEPLTYENVAEYIGHQSSYMETGANGDLYYRWSVSDTEFINIGFSLQEDGQHTFSSVNVGGFQTE